MKTGTGNHTGHIAFGLCFTFILLGIAYILWGAGKVEISSEVQAITSYTYGDSRESLTVVEDIVRATSYGSAERENLEKQFAQVLASNATLECKDFICRQLAVIGTELSIPQLEKMLPSAETSDMARYALATNPSPKVCEALVNALKSAEGNALIGIINTLGDRKNLDNANAVRAYANNSNNAVAMAAATALAKMGR